MNNNDCDLKQWLVINKEKLIQSIKNKRKLGTLSFISDKVNCWENFFNYDPDELALINFIKYRMAGALDIYTEGLDDCDITPPVLAYFKEILLNMKDVKYVKIGKEISHSEKNRVFEIMLEFGEIIYLETDTANSLMGDLNAFLNNILKKKYKMNWPNSTYIKSYNLLKNQHYTYYIPFKYYFFCELLRELENNTLNSEEKECLELLNERAKNIHKIKNMILVPYGYNKKRGYSLKTYKSEIKIYDRYDLTMIDFREMLADPSFSTDILHERLSNEKCSKESIDFLLAHENELFPTVPEYLNDCNSKSNEDIKRRSNAILNAYSKK